MSSLPRPSWLAPLLGFAALVLAGFLATTWVGSRNARAMPEPTCGIALTDAPDDGMTLVRGGTLHLGDGGQRAEELPVTEVAVDDFWISRHDVTNAQYAQFVAATGYRTVAERPAPAPPATAEPPAPSGGAVFDLPGRAWLGMSPGRWRIDPGASWRHPGGAGTDLAGRAAHPVVQIAYDDALAYAQWAGLDLPTEAQWEYAARGGLEHADYAWGSELHPGGQQMANTWQGAFPVYDTAADGFSGTSPVGCFPPNRLGLYDMAGDVWQWTKDWYFPSHGDSRQTNRTGDGVGPSLGVPSFDPQNPDVPSRVIKGGSFLCAANYCASYRPAARQAHESSLGTNHLGFRTVRPVPGDPPPR